MTTNDFELFGAFGFVVDDHGPDKRDGAHAFAATLAERGDDATARHAALCPTCCLLASPTETNGQHVTCAGLILAPLDGLVEQWLIERLPQHLDSLPGLLLQKTIEECDIRGERVATLRAQGRLSARGPQFRQYGYLFRRFVVSSEQLLEELLGVGDIGPAHSLAILLQLGLVTVDGKQLTNATEGETLGELISAPTTRRTRTQLTLPTPPGDGEPSLAGIQSLLRALYAGFVLDADVCVIDSEEATGASVESTPETTVHPSQLS